MLSLEQVKERVKSPQKEQEILTATNQECRLRFHSIPYLKQSEIGYSVTQFLNWVESLLPKDKFKIFCSIFRFPSPVTSLTQSIFTDLSRIFEGRNPVFSYQFNDTKLKDDWEYYRQNILKEPQVWREKGWKKMQMNINSFLIVDLPPVQSKLPEPYFYWLDINSVIDYEIKDGEVEWIIFNSKEGIAVFDDTSYRLFSRGKAKELGTLIVENKHTLGYCPARFFWTDSIGNEDLKESPLSSQLSNLDWLLYWMISKRHLDSYGSYPILSTIKAECSYRSEVEYCDGGFLRHSNDQIYTIAGDGSLKRCPVCGDRRFAGAGTVIERPVPTKDSAIDKAVDIITIDKDSLEWNTEEEKRLKDVIYTNIVGLSNELSKTSYSEEQVQNGIENKVIKLLKLKANFEQAQKFIDDTVCKLRYGDAFLSSNISYGTEFLVYSIDSLYKRYKDAKDSGLSEIQLDNILDQIISTLFRNNPLEVQRMLILKQLEPYRHLSKDEVIKWKDELNEEEIKIKLDFSSLIDRFERENINIIEFAANKDFNTKIKTIKEELLKYVKDENKTEEAASTDNIQTADEGAKGDSGGTGTGKGDSGTRGESNKTNN